jgi:hypothetical protein
MMDIDKEDDDDEVFCHYFGIYKNTTTKSNKNEINNDQPDA